MRRIRLVYCNVLHASRSAAAATPIAVAQACRPCAHIITLAPSSWLAVHANCGCVRVGSLPPLQSSSSWVYVIGN
ncbi:hypothetical protein EDB89DRAFT_1933176, partial [Lactarius sanguifluus]